VASMNRVFLVGNLGSTPELRTTPGGTNVTTLNLATNDVRKSAAGERQELTEWHRVVVWGKQAEDCTRYLTKGRTVLVEGRLATRSWGEAPEPKRYVTEVVASVVRYLGGRMPTAPGEGHADSKPRSGADEWANKEVATGAARNGGAGLLAQVAELDVIPFLGRHLQGNAGRSQPMSFG